MATPVQTHQQLQSEINRLNLRIQKIEDGEMKEATEEIEQLKENLKELPKAGGTVLQQAQRKELGEKLEKAKDEKRDLNADIRALRQQLTPVEQRLTDLLARQANQGISPSPPPPFPIF